LLEAARPHTLEQLCYDLNAFAINRSPHVASLGVGLGMMGIEIKGITDAKKDSDKDRPK
jgi:hypothetical protein